MAGRERPLVLLPGACLGGWVWRDVAAALRGHGHDVSPVTLTGLGERVHLADASIDLQTHVADVVNLLDYADLDEVILVGHSYAGAVVTAVAEERPRRLAAVVYLDTGPLPSGTAIVDVLSDEQRERQRRDVEELGDGWRWPVPDRETLRSGLFGSTAGLSASHLDLFERRATPQPYATFTSALQLSGKDSDPDVRRAAIFCSDGGLDVETLRGLIATGDPRAARFAAADWELHELRTGHWPMLSVPGPLAELLHRIAACRADGVLHAPAGMPRV